MSKENLHNKNKGFGVPDGYFESFEDRLFERVKNASDSIPGKDGFIAPKDYFDSFEDTLVKKIDASSKKSKVIKFNIFKKYYYISIGAAACLALIFLVNQFTSNDTITFATLENDEIENYLYTGEFSSDVYEIVQHYNDTELKEVSLIDETLEKEDDLINYLNENTDYDQLIDED